MQYQKSTLHELLPKNKLMSKHADQSIAEQLLADLRHERQLVDLMIRGCIKLRWAIAKRCCFQQIAQDEKEIAEAMIYNAFETYAVERGMSLKAAERFCEQHLEELIQSVLAVL